MYYTEQQSTGLVSTTGESDADENNGTEDSDSDSAPYFPCHVCGKTFPTSESLEDHQRCHLGEKPHECPFKCGICGKTFAVKRYLREHERRHHFVMLSLKTLPSHLKRLLAL
uniref:C2H2-type domain-containing protein n=1 Tax=Dicentrarchus labrax TaxID=13489 RepID=A0A8C4F642_DICLA